MIEKGTTRKRNIRHALEVLLPVVFFLYVVAQALFNEDKQLIAVPNAVLLVFFGLSVLYLFSGAKFEFGLYMIFTGLFVAICFLSMVWAMRTDMALSKATTLLKLWLMFIFVFNALYQTKKLELFPIALLVGNLLMCVYLLIVYGPSEYLTMISEGDRVGGAVANENSIGLMATTACLICFYYGMLLNKKRFYLLLPLPLVTVAASGSRKALVLLIFSFIMMYFLRPRIKNDKRRFIKGLLGAVMAVAVFVLVLQLPIFDMVKERMQSFFNVFDDSSQADGSTLVRLKMIEAGWEVFCQKPFSGVGIGNSPLFVFEYTGRPYYTHNNYIELLSSVGIFGALLYYASYAYVVVMLLRRIKKREPIVLLCTCMVAITLVEDLAMVSYYSKGTYLELAFYFLVIKTLYTRDAEAKRAAYDAEHPFRSPFSASAQVTPAEEEALPAPIGAQLDNIVGFDIGTMRRTDAPFFVDEALSSDYGKRFEFEPPTIKMPMGSTDETVPLPMGSTDETVPLPLGSTDETVPLPLGSTDEAVPLPMPTRSQLEYLRSSGEGAPFLAKETPTAGHGPRSGSLSDNREDDHDL